MKKALFLDANIEMDVGKINNPDPDPKPNEAPLDDLERERRRSSVPATVSHSSGTSWHASTYCRDGRDLRSSG